MQIFDPPLHPRSEKPHVFELSKIGKNTITFRGISEGSHRKLSYERVSPDHFMIRFQTIEGRNVEINCVTTAEINQGSKTGEELKAEQK